MRQIKLHSIYLESDDPTRDKLALKAMIRQMGHNLYGELSPPIGAYSRINLCNVSHVIKKVDDKTGKLNAKIYILGTDKGNKLKENLDKAIFSIRRKDGGAYTIDAKIN